MAEEEKNNQNNGEKSQVAKREEETLAFWQKNKIFEKSVARPAGKEPEGEFVFYDGPPFATGLPHFGHLLPTSLKDAIPRYQTMNGKRVERRWGWDCHGLPVENIIEKELNLNNKKDIEEYGLGNFNQKARESVLKYADAWREVIPRMGRWVDMDNDYKTMEASYTESIWWSFKELHNKGLIYEGYKSMQLCPRCETTLSNFEVNQGYKDITDLSVTAKFELEDEPGTFVLAWTTTPWTLPGNVALAVNSEVDYVKVKIGEEKFILAKERMAETLIGENENFEIVEEFKGKDLVGKKYKPIFDYYSKTDISNKENGGKIYGADFVTTEDGTGVVHIAPAFGEDDMRLGQENNLSFIQHVGQNGKFKSEVTDFADMPVKPKSDDEKTRFSADIEVIKYLQEKGNFFSKKKITHSYAHCWRCDTPLLNYAANSWFVKVTDFKNDIVAQNKTVNWVPDHIKEGRFGKWLEGARDWAISRTRFWGAPLPVWRCGQCSETKVFGSMSELSEQLPAQKNNYYFMRHGQAEHNVKDLVSSQADRPHHLTADGKVEAEKAGEELKSKKIDLIISSPFVRTKETAEIVAEKLGLSSDSIIYDERIGEVKTGDFDNKPIEEYRKYFSSTLEKFTKRSPGGENLTEMKNRFGDFLYDINEKYEGKNILLITHEYGSWMLDSAAKGLTPRQASDIKDLNEDYIETGEIRELNFKPLPHNENYELDLHRPYIDEVKFACSCGGQFKRISDIFDCWYESGSMPFAQKHYPFADDKSFNPQKGTGFPADFIAEGLDQTRGWFYSLIVLSTALFGSTPYKNVVVNGLILAEDGRKMSKSLQNYPDLNLTINKYGADALRFFMLASPAVHAEEFAFSEKALQETYRRVILRLENVFAFYETYAEKQQSVFDEKNVSNVLDKWIISRLWEMVGQIHLAMGKYELDRAVRPIDDFIDDFSTWYIRRSRTRFKSQDEQEKNDAAMVTEFVLKNLALACAPFMPFISESVYQALKNESEPESVHLSAWPKAGQPDEEVLQQMKKVRNFVVMGLEARSKAGIKVRQPLSKLTINEELPEQYLEIIADEVNVKKVAVDVKAKTALELTLELTLELVQEGQYRDLAREIQDLRKKEGMNPNDAIVLEINTGDAGQKIIKAFEEELKKTVNAKELVITGNETAHEVFVGDLKFGISLK